MTRLRYSTNCSRPWATAMTESNAVAVTALGARYAAMRSCIMQIRQWPVPCSVRFRRSRRGRCVRLSHEGQEADIKSSGNGRQDESGRSVARRLPPRPNNETRDQQNPIHNRADDKQKRHRAKSAFRDRTGQHQRVCNHRNGDDEHRATFRLLNLRVMVRGRNVIIKLLPQHPNAKPFRGWTGAEPMLELTRPLCPLVHCSGWLGRSRAAVTDGLHRTRQTRTAHSDSHSDGDTCSQGHLTSLVRML